MKQRIIIALIILALIAAFFVFNLGQYFSLEFLQTQKVSFSELYQAKPTAISMLYFGLYVLVTAVALPAAAILTLAGGAIFGFWYGLLLVSFASSIGATIAFLLTRYLLRDGIEQRFPKQFTAINKGVEKEGAFYVFAMRLVPVFPFFVVNSLLALTSLKTSTFYWVSQLGMLIGTAVYVNAGTQLAQLQSTSDILSVKLLLSFALLGLFPIVAKKALNKITNMYRRKESNYE